ncbi:MAG: hypothetical protein PUD34_01380 [bacterium]|nr:hypothetical protein [bacterium]
MEDIICIILLFFLGVICYYCGFSSFRTIDFENLDKCIPNVIDMIFFFAFGFSFIFMAAYS